MSRISGQKLKLPALDLLQKEYALVAAMRRKRTERDKGLQVKKRKRRKKQESDLNKRNGVLPKLVFYKNPKTEYVNETFPKLKKLEQLSERYTVEKQRDSVMQSHLETSTKRSLQSDIISKEKRKKQILDKSAEDSKSGVFFQYGNTHLLNSYMQVKGTNPYQKQTESLGKTKPVLLPKLTLAQTHNRTRYIINEKSLRNKTLSYKSAFLKEHFACQGKMF